MYDLLKIKTILYEAVTNKYEVELRIEDRNMVMDITMNIKLTNSFVNEENNSIVLEAPGLNLRFKYDSCNLGTESDSHNKFYFETDKVFLTVVVKK